MITPVGDEVTSLLVGDEVICFVVGDDVASAVAIGFKVGDTDVNDCTVGDADAKDIDGVGGDELFGQHTYHSSACIVAHNSSSLVNSDANTSISAQV